MTEPAANLWLVIADEWCAELAPDGWRRLPPFVQLSRGTLLAREEAAAVAHAQWLASAAGVTVHVVRIPLPQAWAQRPDVAAELARLGEWTWVAPYDVCLHVLPEALWRELDAALPAPLVHAHTIVPAPPVAEPARVTDWTALRGLEGSDCIARAELVRAPVADVATALGRDARLVVPDLFGACVPFATHHRLVYRLVGHAWSCVVTWDGLGRSIDVKELYARLRAPVLECSVSDSDGSASISRTEHGDSEYLLFAEPWPPRPSTVQFAGATFTARQPFALVHAILSAHDACWIACLRGRYFVDSPPADEPREREPIRFAPELRWGGERVPVEAAAWIAW